MEYAQGAQYWDRRYREDPECFEWYHEYEEIEAVLRRYIKANDKVLVLGCGNSMMSAKICDRLQANVTSVDVSSVVVSHMQKQQQALASTSSATRSTSPQNCAYIVGDARFLDAVALPHAAYDVVIEKGLFDALLCHDDAGGNAHALLRGVHGLLRSGQPFISISCAHPGLRKGYFVDNTVSALGGGLNSLPAFAWDVAAPVLVGKEPIDTEFTNGDGEGVQFGPADALNVTVADEENIFVYVLKKRLVGS